MMLFLVTILLFYLAFCVILLKIVLFCLSLIFIFNVIFLHNISFLPFGFDENRLWVLFYRDVSTQFPPVYTTTE